MRGSPAVVLCLVCSAGCSSPPATAVDDGGAPTSSCRADLSAFCAGACPSYDDSVADVRQLASGGRCLIAESGSCGSGRYTSYSSGFFGFTSWFDGGGRLLASYQFSDAPVFCDRSSFSELFGDPPPCARTPTARYCP